MAALDLLAKGGGAPDDWKTQQLAIIEQTNKPTAQLLLMPTPAIQRLVEAAAGGGSCAAAK